MQLPRQQRCYSQTTTCWTLTAHAILLRPPLERSKWWYMGYYCCHFHAEEFKTYHGEHGRKKIFVGFTLAIVIDNDGDRYSYNALKEGYDVSVICMLITHTTFSILWGKIVYAVTRLVPFHTVQPLLKYGSDRGYKCTKCNAIFQLRHSVC